MNQQTSMREHFLNYGAGVVKLYDALEEQRAINRDLELEVARLTAALNEARDELYRLQNLREFHIIERTAAQEQFAVALTALTSAKANIDTAIERDLESQQSERERKQQLEEQLRSTANIARFEEVAASLADLKPEPVEEVAASLPAQQDRFPHPALGDSYKSVRDDLAENAAKMERS
jgi:hypothetical protein